MYIHICPFSFFGQIEIKLMIYLHLNSTYFQFHSLSKWVIMKTRLYRTPIRNSKIVLILEVGFVILPLIFTYKNQRKTIL